jgi:hypothetical protein
MTKLRWDKADEYEPDPGAMIEAPEPAIPSRWVGPDEQRRRHAEAAKKRQELRERSEQHDRELLTRGLERRIRDKQDCGIPLSGLERLILKSLDKH